ncbi:MAG TPA: hypothetical protein VF384_03140 [Planctomycetota bacterium]
MKPIAMLCLLCSAAAAVGQAPPLLEPAKLRARAAAVEVKPLWDVPWSHDGLVQPGTRWGERLTAMAFSNDGASLAVLGDGYVDLGSGRSGRSAGREVLVGSAGADEFLFFGEELVRGSATGERREVGLRPPYRTEANGSPTGRFVLVHGRASVPHRGDLVLVDLTTQRKLGLPLRARIVTAIAWSPDETLFALAVATGSDTAGGILVFDTLGKVVLRQRPDSEAPVTALAFDLDGRSILWSGRLLHRVDVRTGRALAWGEARLRWLAPVDQDLVLGHDGRKLVWLTARALLVARELDLEVGEDKEGVNAAALSPGREVLAIAHPQSLRVYRVSRP